MGATALSSCKLLFLFFNVYFCLFLAVLGLHCCRGFSLVAVSRGYSTDGVRWLLIAVTSCCGAQALGCVSFSGCDTRAQWRLLSGSGAVARGLSGSSACGIFPD